MTHIATKSVDEDMVSPWSSLSGHHKNCGARAHGSDSVAMRGRINTVFSGRESPTDDEAAY